MKCFLSLMGRKISHKVLQIVSIHADRFAFDLPRVQNIQLYSKIFNILVLVCLFKTSEKLLVKMQLGPS